MQTLNKLLEKMKDIKIREKTRIAGAVFLRWSYLLFLISMALYVAYIFNIYAFKADWSEEKKKKYIEEQSVFSYNKSEFEKTLEMMDRKKEKLEHAEKFSGRDIFFPGGF